MKHFALAIVFGVLLFQADARAQSTGSRVLLLGAENVRNELRLSSAQRQSLDSLRKKYREEARELVSAGDAGSASRLQTITQAYDNQAIAVLSPAQAKSLGLIERKVLGAWMLTSPEVQQKLALTDSQKSKVARIQQQLYDKNAEQNRLLDEGKITPFQRLEKLRNTRLKSTRSLEKLLTKQQLAALRSIGG